MFLRISRVQRRDKTYEYVQLVESYRRESDRMPMQRVVANLGSLSAEEIANLRAALEASRQGRNVVVAPAPVVAPRSAPKPVANLRYLDVAVLLALWRELGLDAVLDDALPQGASDVRPSAVVAALAIQRCCDAGSKLYATRWFPRTALPEMMAIAPKAFHNTRLHRELDALDTGGQRLMAKLPALHMRRDGVFASLFVDATDAWFEGNGLPLAKMGKTKEGLFKRKIGIVLLCNERGYPLRWEVVEGNRPDCRTLGDMFRSVQRVPWIGEAPIVVDRAMGKSAQLAELSATGLRFLTALTRPEFDSYTQDIPHHLFAGLEPNAESRGRDLLEARRLAEAGGFERVDDNLYVRDLGVVERAEPLVSEPPDPDEDLTVGVMRSCRDMHEAVESGRLGSLAAAGRELGLRNGLVKKYCRLSSLDEGIQRDVLAGRAAGHPLAALLELAKRESSEQREAFERLIAVAPRRRPRPAAPKSAEQREHEQSVRIRAVAYFNPTNFIDQRMRAQARLDDVRAFVDELNGRLASPHSRHSRRSLSAAIDRKLRDLDMLSIFEPEVTETRIVEQRVRYQAALTFNATAWARVRRYDGFSVLAGHPALTHGAAELCRLYRAKDAVEKDFQVIKGLVQLQPLRHRTDAKVRAHVTICMLALTLERHLRNRLGSSGYTAEAALELLRTCHLNQYDAPTDAAAYTITRTDADQDAILAALGFQDLADDDVLTERLTPR